MNIIDDVLTSFTTRIHSHRSSWPRMQACMLKDIGINVEFTGGDLATIEAADTWYVSHGMEFKDVYNLNSGWTAEHATRLRLMIEKGPQRIISLERPLPNFEQILRPRVEKSDNKLTDAEWQELAVLTDNVRTMTHREIWMKNPHKNRVVLGDSHSIARYRRGTLVLRNDGLTLHGLLKRGIRTMLHEAGVFAVENLVIQAGNIDIRHHLARQENPKQAVETLVSELWTQLQDLVEHGEILTYEVTAPYPIEHEGRSLPKTGYYKGTPFYGCREDRVDIASWMMTEMMTRFPKVHYWPQRWYDMDPEQYANEFMEKPRSVHLSPEFHQWDYIKNESRK